MRGNRDRYPIGLALIALLAGLWLASAAAAGPIAGDCGAGCSIKISIDGQMPVTGSYDVDPKTGALSLSAPLQTKFGDSFLSVDSVSGNVDPILGFSTSAGTGAGGGGFSITLTLPIQLTGTILANSSVSYSLTALTADGAQVAPLVGLHVVTAQEVDTSVEGLDPLNKGVDVGDKFSFKPLEESDCDNKAPCTLNSPVFTSSNSFMGDLAYDLMSVTVSFSLSANSNTGLSGFVQQVPEASTLAMLVLGLGGLAAVSRRRQAR